jgi:glucosamine kinase
MSNYIIGVDGGGTKTHAVLVDRDKNIIDECFYGPANIKTNLNLAYSAIAGSIDELLLRNSLVSDNVKIGVGVAGYSVTDKRNKLTELLSQKYSRIKINSDCHIACLAAHAGTDGAIIICGTGVVGYYIEQKTAVQIGGWGFPHGDLGGAAWIGLQICQHTCQAIDGAIEFSPLLNAVFNKFNQDANSYKTWLLNATPSDYAGIAQLLPQFKTIDSLACSILSSAINNLVLFTEAVINRVPQLPIKLVGGLAPLFVPAIKSKFAQVLLTKHVPAWGACFLF